jgi:hypothetical protein
MSLTDLTGGLSLLNITELGQLFDVNITSPTNGQVLTYSNGEWVNGAGGGGGGGTVTDVSVVSANGLAGTVATSTTTPAITLSTTITGILKGDGTAISTASAGTDYTNAAFKTFAVAGQSDIVADSASDTFTVVAGTGITLTTDASTDSLTITGTGGTVTSVSGTTNRITSSGGATPVIDIAATYVGQSSLTTLGTVTNGTWHSVKVELAYGGTNADLSATGGTSQVLRQSSSGAAVTVSQLAASDLSNGTTGSGAVVLATSPALITPNIGKPSAGDLGNCTDLPISTGVSGLGANVATFLATPSSANLAAAVTGETGSGALVFATSPALITPNLGVPSAGDLANCTDLPISTGVSGLGANIATFLATPSSANLAVAVTGETGSGALVFATSPVLVTPNLGVPSAGDLANCTDLPISTGVSGLGANVATFLATPSSANLAAAVTGETGSGALVFATSPALITPALGRPSNGDLANCTDLPISTGVSGLGANVATFLATPSSANLISAVTDETGSGVLVFATSPTLVTPLLGTPTSGVLTNCTGTASGLTSGVTLALKSATTSVDVSAATAPTNGQALVATSGTTATWQTLSGTGTVTSVAQTVPGGVSISGSPVTTAGTLAIAANGTSGGVLYYSSGTTSASSATLAANGVVVGGGAGATPATTPMTVSSTGAVAAYLGTINAQTGTTYTLSATDTGKIVECSNASAITVTLPNSLVQGFCTIITQTGAGQVTLSPAAGAVLHNASSFTKTRAQYAGLTLYVSTNTNGTTATYGMFGDGA